MGEGFIQGIFASLIAGFISYVLFNFSAIRNMIKDNFPLYGEWILYYFNYDVGESEKSPKMQEENLTIYRKWYQLKMRIISNHSKKQIVYKGEATISKNWLNISLYDSQFKENVNIAFSVPNIGASSINNDIKLFGVAQAVDFNGRPSVNAVVVSKKQLTEENVRSFMKTSFSSSTDCKVIVVKKQGLIQ